MKRILTVRVAIAGIVAHQIAAPILAATLAIATIARITSIAQVAAPNLFLLTLDPVSKNQQQIFPVQVENFIAEK